MDPGHRVQVVLGEAERTDGLLRFILEGEGFDIVGLASDDDELEHVLRGARPQVVVLDGGISAPAALEARERAEGASLVVVWPDGVAAVIAEERVDPSSSISDLGDAVRRAAEFAQVGETTIRMPEAHVMHPDVESRPARHPDVRKDPIVPTRSRGRRGQLLAAAATWMLALTALASIAIAVPNALNLSSRHGGGRPSPGVSVTGPDERTTTPQRTGGTELPPTCDDPAAPTDRTDRSRGAASTQPVRAEGCRPGRAQGPAGTKGKGKGRPDDPGSKANGHGSPEHVAGKGRGGSDGSKETHGQGAEHRNAAKARVPGSAGHPEKGEGSAGHPEKGEGSAGPAEKGKGSAGHAARADAGNPG